MPPKAHFLAPTAPAYTPLQQDRQARNRPSHVLPSATASPAEARGSEIWRDETFESRERRRQAAMYLESNEMLIWYASSRNESIPQTRRHFEKILAGCDTSSDAEDVDWADDWDYDTDECERKWEKKEREREREKAVPLASPASPASTRAAEQQRSASATGAGNGGAGERGGNARGGTPRKVSSPRSKGGRGKGEQKRKDGKRSGGGGGGSGHGGSAAA